MKVARLYNDGRLAIKGNLTVIPKSRGLITDGLVMHLDADNENSIVKDGSNRISEWKDLSGYANHAMQVNTNEQPLLNVNAMNGRNTIKLNGTQHLSVPPSTVLEISPYLSIFAVVKLDSHGKEFNIITNKETNWNNRNWWLLEWNKKWVFRQSEAGSVNLESDVVSTTNPTMIGIVADGSRINMFIDGLPQSGYMDYSYLPTQSSMVGIGRQVDYIENRNWVGDIGEILIYNTFLTEADRKSIEQYLGEKWLGWDADNEEPVFNLKSNGDLEIPIKLILGGEGFSITNKQIKIKQIIEGAGDILVHRYVHQGNKVIQPTGLDKSTGLFTTTEPIALPPGTKRQVITAFNYQSDGSIPREWRGVDGHYIDVVSSTSFYIRSGSANGTILTYTNTNNNLVDVNSFRFEYDFRGNYQVDLSEYNIKKGKFNFKGTRHRPGWTYIDLNVNHSEGNSRHSFGTFADGRDYLSLDVTGLFSIEDNFARARIKEYIKTEWNDSNGTWVNYQGSNGNVLNQSFDSPSFGILDFRYAMANGSVVEIYDTEHSLE